MLTEERLNKIMDLLNKHGRVKSKHLSEILSVSEVTIRNDLNTLEKKGLLSRVHGGAVKVKGGYYSPHQTNYYPYMKQNINKKPRIMDPHFQEQIALDKEEKRDIAKKAVSVVEKNDVIFVDTGSSAYYFIEEIVKNPPINLTVVTNSLYVINEVAGHNNINLLVLGGVFQRSSLNFLDLDASPLIEKYSVNKIFMGINGLDEVGFYSSDILEARVKSEFCDLTAQLYLFASSSKLFKKSLKIISEWKGSETLIVSDKRGPFRDKFNALEKEKMVKII
jgi:DeoR/GlpR family transcriptional regulator of sugar metabolism